jgi:glycosyltransferase involved in cell wall biosynthesis
VRRLRVLALTPYPSAAACTRFRVTEYGPLLAEHGIDLRVRSVLGAESFARFYGAGGRIQKGKSLLEGTFAQLWDVARADVDVVLVQREATLLGPAFIEWMAARVRRIPLVYDLDDSIWESTTSFSRHPLAARLLKFPEKTWHLMQMADHVIAGSEYLVQAATRHNGHVSLLPTVVSRRDWVPLPGRLEGALTAGRGDPVIGWIGTHTTALTLQVVAPALRRLQASGRRFVVRIIGAGQGFEMPGVTLETRPWRQEREIRDFQELDIGIAPLLPIQFSRGKCAFKQLEYMAVGVPSVSSPDGGALDFIRHGENGMLARTEDEWVDALGSLLDDASLRARLARAGRSLVEQTHCTEAQAPRLAAILRSAARGGVGVE